MWYDGFTEEELDAAPRLIVVPHINLLTVMSWPRCGTQYDLSQGCPACGSGSPQILWDDKQCQVCKRESFGPESPLRLCYRASDVAQFDEVTETWEVYCETHLALGPNQYPLIGRPWLLVTPRVMRAMLAAGGTEDHCVFIPIRVVDE